MGRARKYDKRVRNVSKMFEPFMNDLKFLMEEQKLTAKEFSKNLDRAIVIYLLTLITLKTTETLL